MNGMIQFFKSFFEKIKKSMDIFIEFQLIGLVMADCEFFQKTE